MTDPLDFATGAGTVLARSVSAEIRAICAAHRISVRTLAQETGMSLNYLAKRLRDEMAFTLDDVDRVARLFDRDGAELINKAYDNHGEHIFFLQDQQRLAAVAHEEDTAIEDEQGHDEFP